MADRERFPVPQAAIAVLLAHKDNLHEALAAVAPHLVQAWIQALPDAELLALKFSGRDWCRQMREQMLQLAQDT
jgi:hypothetical protein